MGHTAFVSTGEVSLVFASWAVLSHLVCSISAVILAIAEQPLWDATVVGRAWASSPSSCAVPVAAEVSWLICVVPTIVVIVTVPQLGNTLSISALEFRLFVAGALVAQVLSFVRSIHTVGISVTLPGAKDATTRLLALELMLRALMVAVLLITPIPTVVPPVADCSDKCAIIVLALELTVPALSLWARSGLV